MKLKQLAARPQLLKIELTDEKIVELYGEPVEFYVYDRLGLDAFLKLAAMQDDNNISELAEFVKTLVHDEEGNKILEGEDILPVEVMLKVVEETIKQLGNSVTQTSAG